VLLDKLHRDLNSRFRGCSAYGHFVVSLRLDRLDAQQLALLLRILLDQVLPPPLPLPGSEDVARTRLSSAHSKVLFCRDLVDVEVSGALHEAVLVLRGFPAGDRVNETVFDSLTHDVVLNRVFETLDVIVVALLLPPLQLQCFLLGPLPALALSHHLEQTCLLWLSLLVVCAVRVRP